MRRIRMSYIILWAFAAFHASSLFGAIPQSISYQGRLTDIAGTPVNDTVDLDFLICPDSLCDRPLWMEAQNGVIVKDGLFAVLLGSITPIPPSVFSGSVRWLSISKDGVTASRALRMVSAPYAFKSLMADTAYYAKSMGEIDCSDCELIFVNTIGPDSVISTTGTALAGKAIGSGTADFVGMRGHASNKGIGLACGGLFATADSGTGLHFGVRGEAYGSASNLVQGIVGYGSNMSGGEAYGGFFSSHSGGTGIHYGLRAEGSGSSSNPTFGTFGLAQNTSSGAAIGGWFQTSSPGTGAHYGVRTETYGASSSGSYGVKGWASNSSTGDAYGGDFSTNTGGAGVHYGVRGAASASSSANTYGFYGSASNNSTGRVYGGYFETSSSGTGIHYGVMAEALSSSGWGPVGVYANAENSSNGDVYAGQFWAPGTGTGISTGVKVSSTGNSNSPTYGIDCTAKNFSTGKVYAGYFYATDLGTGIKYGVYAISPDYAGWFDGDLVVTNGMKSAAVKVDNGEYRLLYAMESPENWFEDFGGGSLQNGATTVMIDPLFAQSVSTQIEYRVYLTPEGDCKGLYVTNKTASSFEVRELQGGTSSVYFSYRIVAKRKGYEDVRMRKILGPPPEQIEKEHEERQTVIEQERQRLRQDRPTTERETTEPGQE